MCGKFENMIPNAPLKEWNSYCDPFASEIVYQSEVKRFRSIGLDVTLQLRMSKEEIKDKFKADILKPVIDFADVWFQYTDEMVFHDSLAAAVIFDEEICKYKRGIVDVETKSDLLAGLTHWTPSDVGPIEVAFEVDKERFFEHYFEIINM